jgi:hypothetical protein
MGTPLKTEDSRARDRHRTALMRRLLPLIDERATLAGPTALMFASHNGTGI